MTDAIQTSAEYAAQVIAVYDQIMEQRGLTFRGACVLEIGPGRDFAPQLAMVDRGAEVTVADRFLATWDDDYHPALYQAVIRLIGPSPAITRVLKQGGYDGVIRTVSEPAERMPSLSDGEFDLVMSNAVLEHVMNLESVVSELRRISARDAVHTHQVDFRYHRDFTRPLLHLLLPRPLFRAAAWLVNNEAGCQWRPREMAEQFHKAGFSLEDAIVTDSAEDRYLDAFVPRLRASWFSPYRDWTRDDLSPIGVRYWLRA